MKRVPLLFWPLLLCFSSCSWLVTQQESNQFTVLKMPHDNLSIIFSHNIGGETHPCGCRHFPLGGLPQVAGKFSELKEKNSILYVDTGDTLFPNSTLPPSLKRSLSFAAQNLARGLKKLGLSYFVPGDQDFAAGSNFLKQILKENNISLMVANLADSSDLPHTKWNKLIKGPHNIFLTAIVNPETIRAPYTKLFTSPEDALKNILVEIRKNGYQRKNPFHRLIVLSHSGIKFDTQLATHFPSIDWIVGAHSQSFTKFPKTVGNVKIVQVLSRNHYLGEIRISLKHDKSQDKFVLHEMRDELAKKIKPNPFIEFINDHKNKVAQIESEEQKSATIFASNAKFDTAANCMECHLPQTRFWNKTSHSLAYLTLMNVKETKTLKCVKCHSLGQGHARAFHSSNDIVQFDNPSKKRTRSYWKEVTTLAKKIKSVRKLGAKKTSAISQELMEIDDKYNVNYNFAHVQCLNCHSLEEDHPFNVAVHPPKGVARYNRIKSRCLSCHKRDQSPRWYKEANRGNKVKYLLDEVQFLKRYKSLSCPKRDLYNLN